MQITLAAAVILLLGGAGPQEEIRTITLDRDDIVVKEDVVVKAGRYRVADVNDDGVLTVQGDGITIDLGGATLEGSDPKASPENCSGIGIRLVGCKEVTIRNGTIRGFKVGIYARDCDRLEIVDCVVTANFRERLGSTPEREDPSDWLWPHHNDDKEWMRNYGAAIYLDHCRGATVAGNRGRDQQNGIILSHTDGSFVCDNDFSFHSGWGLGMWRSSGNEVSHNRFDYCVRGYSHGVYHRGQDSAGILVFEQCNDNVFAFNSATHGGDGFFLYAGHETTQKTGEGGCNGNLLYGNDFSHAVANGIEATFSKENRFVENILDECDYGIWAGYSYDSLFLRNRISRSLTAGIAIEHGHDNRIEGNTFLGDRRGVWLWWDEDKDLLEGPFGQKQDTDSERYGIYANAFRKTDVGVDLRRTAEVEIAGNEFVDCEEEVKEEECKEVRRGKEVPGEPTKAPPPEVRGSMDAFLPEGGRRGRETMMIDEWGPIDPSALRLFPSKVFGWGDASFYLLGPGGEFTAVARGAKVAPETGTVPATLKVRAPGAGLHEFTLQVRVGKRTLAASGTVIAADWRVRFYRWEPVGPEKGPADWAEVIEKEPIEVVKTDRIDYVWAGGTPSETVPADHFATVATAKIPLPAGTYEFRTVSDDGVRLTIDGKTVIENWTWHPPKEDVATARLEKGTRTFVLEHFEIDGYAQLTLSIRRLE